MVRRGFTPGGGAARSSQVQRPEADPCVVYYQHPYPFESVILAFDATKALGLSIATGPCDWTQVSGSQAFDTENYRVEDHAGSGPGLDPALVPAARLGVIRLFVVCSGSAGSWFAAWFASRFAAL